MPELLTARAVGGPLDGAEVTVRSDRRFLAVDRGAGRAWLYELKPDSTLRPNLDHDDSLIYPQGATTGERAFEPGRAWLAGENSELDIIAVGD